MLDWNGVTLSVIGSNGIFWGFWLVGCCRGCVWCAVLCGSACMWQSERDCRVTVNKSEVGMSRGKLNCQ